LIIDTIYILPLAGIGIGADLLKAIIEGKAPIRFDEIKLNLISIFELQAKASKLNIPPSRVVKAVNVILKNFTIIPYYKPEIIRCAHELKEVIRDYVDRVIVATAITLREDLITEDTEINKAKEKIKKEYGITIYTYNSLVP